MIILFPGASILALYYGVMLDTTLTNFMNQDEKLLYKAFPEVTPETRDSLKELRTLCVAAVMCGVINFVISGTVLMNVSDPMFSNSIQFLMMVLFNIIEIVNLAFVIRFYTLMTGHSIVELRLFSVIAVSFITIANVFSLVMNYKKLYSISLNSKIERMSGMPRMSRY